MCSVLCVILLRVLLESATQRQTDAPFRSPSSNCTGIRINITPEIRNPLAQSCFYWDFSEGEVRLSQVALVRQHLLVNILFYFHWKWEMLVWRMGWGGSWSLTNFPSIPCRGWDQMKHISLRLLLLVFVSPVLLSIPSVFVSCSIFSSLTLNLYHCLDFSLHFPICLCFTLSFTIAVHFLHHCLSFSSCPCMSSCTVLLLKQWAGSQINKMAERMDLLRGFFSPER